MIDYGRKMDIEELMQAIKVSTSRAEKEHFEKILYRIINQSTAIGSLRTELLQATRAKDLNKVRRLQLHIQRVRLEETRGASWGSNKTERKIV